MNVSLVSALFENKTPTWIAAILLAAVCGLLAKHVSVKVKFDINHLKQLPNDMGKC